MSETTLCTVCAVAQLPDALALAESWREAGGEVPLVVVADAVSGSPPQTEGMRVVAGADLAIEGFGFLAAELAAGDLARALVPFALAEAGAPAVHVDPGMRVHAQPAIDGEGLLVGEGVVVLATPQPELLKWWQERAREGESPALLGRFSTVRSAEGVERWARPAAAPESGATASVGYAATADGLELGPLTRVLARRARLAGALTQPVFAPEGAAEFRAWLLEPVIDGLTRATLLTWLERPDLQAGYPDPNDPDDRDGLEGWLATHGPSDPALPSELLPEVPASISTATPRGSRRRERPWGVNVVGEDADAVLEALDAAALPALLVDPSRDPAPFAVNLICGPAEALPQLAETAGGGFFERRRTIALTWSVEVEDSWFERVDEIWVPSADARRTLAPRAPVPVVHVPLPLPASPPASGRAGLGLPAGFLVAAWHDDPAVAEAFERAFGAGDDASLVVAGSRADLDLAALLAAADACLSLRRAGGFDRALATAIAFGTPTVATPHVDDIEAAWLVPFASDLTPSVAAAAAALSTIHDDPAGAAERAARARADILARHAPATAGAAMAHALDRRRRPASRGDAGIGYDAVRRRVSDAREQIATDAADFYRDAGRVRRRAQAGVRRSAAPFEAARRKGDEALAGALDALEHETEVTTERTLVLYADALARARRAERRVTALEIRLGALERGLDVLEPRRARAELDGLVQAARVVPFMAGDPYALFDHPVAGRVLGYRDPRAGVDEQDTYRFFEDVFRGSEDRIRELLAPYVELVRDHAPVLDVGCGRGEFLDLLAAEGIEARGVDADAGMAARAQARGLEVTVADGVDHLRALEDESLGAVTAFQVIEHLPTPVLEQFLLVARRKLRPGGLLIVETVNPHAGHALKTFWVDPTHERPLFPEVVLTLVRGAGFREGFIAHLAGARDVEVDRYNESSYAVVATA